MTLDKVTPEQLPSLPWELADARNPSQLWKCKVRVLLTEPVEGEKKGRAEFNYSLLPYPRVECSVQLDEKAPPLLVDYIAHHIVIDHSGEEIPVFPLKIRQGTDQCTQIDYVVDGSAVLGNRKAKKAVFQLVNFVNCSCDTDLICHNGNAGRRIGHLKLVADEWEVDVTARREIESSIEDAKLCGYAVTHIGEISRLDGKAFEPQQLQEFLETVQSFLSFARGAWCSAHLPMGETADGDTAFWLWYRQVVDKWHHKRNWFPEMQAQTLRQLFPEFVRLWHSDLWHKPLKEVIYWYLLANSLSTVDAAVVLAQNALELLSWTYLVREQECVDEHTFKDVRTSQNIRYLMWALDIPLEIPQGAEHFNKAFKSNKERDLPWALTDVRNWIVHPDNTTIENPKGLPYIASQAALWCIELALLRIMGYEGDYVNRLTAEWVGETEPVPWMKPGEKKDSS